MKRLLRVTAMTGVLTLLRMLMGIVVAKVIAVLMGPSGLAMLGQVQSIIAIFNGVINAPVSNGVVRYTAENAEKGIEVCSTWWRASLLWSLFFIVVLFFIGYFTAGYISSTFLDDPTLVWIIYTVLLVSPLTVFGTLFTSIINGQQNYQRYVILGIITVLISNAVMLLLITKGNINGALLAVIIQPAIIGGIMLVANVRQPWFFYVFSKCKIAKNEILDIGRYIIIAIVSAAMLPISLMFIRNILIEFTGWQQTGEWQAVWKISEVYLGVVTMALGTYYLPRLSSISGVNNIKREIKQTIKIIIPLLIFSTIVIYFLRDFIILLIFSTEFKDARNLFLIQLIGDIVKITCWLYSYPMIARGAVKWFVFSEILFSFSLVIFAYFFVKNFGVEGANLAYLINYILYFIFVFFNFEKYSR